MRSRRRFLVALEVKGHAAAEIDGLRRALSSPETERIAPHITLVAPLNVAELDVAEAVDIVRQAASSMTPIAVELGPPTRFSHRHDLSYLAVGGDLAAIEQLRQRLSRGVLSAPSSRPERAFIAHVTLSSRLEPARTDKAIEALSGFAMTHVFQSVELMEQDLEAPTRPWHGAGSFAFSPRHVTGRGGRELEFVLSDEPDPVVRRFFDDAWGAYLDETYGETTVFSFSLACLERGRPVAVALGYVVGDIWDLERLVVAADRRGEGIGSALLSHLERVAIDRDGARIRLRTNASGRARELYGAHGYVVTATLENWRDDHAFVAMERRL